MSHISVIIPVHDRHHFLLTRSIPSVLKQSFSDWELIVVGDAPPDRQIYNVVASFKDPRIKYVETERPDYSNVDGKTYWHCAGATARNYGLQFAQGEYIAPLDDDDEFTPHHLRDSMRCLEQCNLDFVYGATIVRNFESGSEYVDFIPWERSVREGLFPDRNIMFHSNVVYRAKYKHILYPTIGEIAADWGLWQKLYSEGARFGDISPISDEPQSVYYIPIAKAKVRTSIPFMPSGKEWQMLIENVYERKVLSYEPEVPIDVKFESLVSEQLAGAHVNSTLSGEAGLVMTLQAIKRVAPFGCNQILLPSYAPLATANTIIWCGFAPVLIDIDPDHLGVDAKTIEPHISHKTAGILPVHSHGNPVDIDSISALAQIHKVNLIWDATSAFGAHYKGKPVGSISNLSVFSFDDTRTISVGGGGVVTCNDETLYQKLKLTPYIMQSDQHQTKGLNAKISSLHAAMGTLIIPKTQHLVSTRQTIAERYCNNLAPLGINLPNKVHKSVVPSYTDLPLIFENAALAKKVQKTLQAHGIQTKQVEPLHRMQRFHQFAPNRLSATDAIVERVVCMPIFHAMRVGLVDRICEIICDQVTNRWD